MKITILRIITTFFAVVLLVSCDKDYNTIGGDLIGGENFNFTPGEEFGSKVYHQKLGAIQTNNLAINQLGVYEHEVFGTTQANFVTQLTLGTVNPTFGDGVVLDSVVLSIPYVSTRTTDKDGKTTYKLEDINGTGKINLAVFRNNYELIDFNPDTDLTTNSRYFSDQDAAFDGLKSGLMTVDPLILDNRLNDRTFDSKNNRIYYENTEFTPSNKEILIYKVESKKNSAIPYVMEHKPTSEVSQRLAPTMRLRLNSKYFEDNIIKTNATNLKDNNAFKKYFKGLYFQAKNIVSANGSSMALDFKRGNITIYYKEDKIVKEKNSQGVEVVVGNDRPMKTVVLNFTGNTVNLYNTNEKTGYLNAFTPANQPSDFEVTNMYVKGANGSLGFIELFTNTGELQALRDKKPFLNEASITFTVNRTIMNSSMPALPRLYLYDAEGEKTLIDYNFDSSTNVSDSKKNRFIFGGILEETKDDAGAVIKQTYKFRITEFINRILKEEQDNVRLAVVVTDNINDASNTDLKNNITKIKSNSGGKNTITKVPSASAYSQLGTVLHGSFGDNRVKFIINYTTKK